MERHKWRGLKTMLIREEQDIGPFIEEMKNIEDVVRACYEKPLCDEGEIDNNEFLEMLVLDGCFMLEFLRGTKLGFENLKYGYDDPIFSRESVIHVIGRDMIKLENQLPTIVLEKLMAVQYYPRPIKNDIPKLVLRALTPIWITNEILSRKQLKVMRDAVVADPRNEMLHCLDIFRSSLLHRPPTNSEERTAAKSTDTVMSNGFQQSSVLDKPSSISGNHITALEETRVEMTEMASTSRSQIDQDEPLLIPEAQHVQQSSRTSIEDGFIPTRLPMGQQLYSDNESEGPISNSSLNSEGSEGTNSDAENKRRIMSCLPDAMKKIPKFGRRPKHAYEKIRANSELMVYCVQDLRDAGVKLKMRTSQPFWDINFDKHRGLLEIPPIKIDDATKTVFLNLIAYEQCHYRQFSEMPITDYVAFMDKLVNSGDDVGRLHRAGIIVHGLGSDEEVSDLFNRLVKNALVNWEQGGLSEMYKQLNTYCTHRRHRWVANLRHDYLKNPWVLLSIFVAICLFILSILQTGYTIRAYHVPPKST